MEALNTVLPVLLYTFGIILLIVLIILGIRLIQILDKVEKAVDDTIAKVNSFNEAIGILSKAAYGVTTVSDKVISGLIAIISKIFNKKDKEEKEEDYFE
ncbi:MAG: hypothetical protein E7160_03330 [Firmicutes bacterium]|nr:hypothetical protein [Bacillota bacterium]